MIILNENTEEKLAKLIDSIKNKAAGIRCVHLQLSQADGLKADIKKISNIINGVIVNSDLRIFHCKDGDIFIIASLISNEIFEKLKIHVSTFLGIPSNSLNIDLYELSKDWSVVSVLCDAKLKIISSAKEAKEKQASDTKIVRKHHSILNMHIEDELIKALSTRRTNRKQPEILIVEDDVFSRRLVTGSLSKEYKVTGAKDGREAIQQYALHGPDVMFLDIELPDVNGHEILQKILSFDPNAYIIMLSGKGDKENVLQAIHEGAMGFISKPFTKEKLLQYINKCPTIN